MLLLCRVGDEVILDVVCGLLLLLCHASVCAAVLAPLGVVRFSGLVFLINRVIRLSAFLLVIYEKQLRLAFQSKTIEDNSESII